MKRVRVNIHGYPIVVSKDGKTCGRGLTRRRDLVKVKLGHFRSRNAEALLFPTDLTSLFLAHTYFCTSDVWTRMFYGSALADHITSSHDPSELDFDPGIRKPKTLHSNAFQSSCCPFSRLNSYIGRSTNVNFSCFPAGNERPCAEGSESFLG